LPTEGNSDDVKCYWAATEDGDGVRLAAAFFAGAGILGIDAKHQTQPVPKRVLAFFAARRALEKNTGLGYNPEPFFMM